MPGAPLPSGGKELGRGRSWGGGDGLGTSRPVPFPRGRWGPGAARKPKTRLSSPTAPGPADVTAHAFRAYIEAFIGPEP